MYKVRSLRSTPDNEVFLVPNINKYPDLAKRIEMASKGIPLPDMSQPQGIAKPFLDLEDHRGIDPAQLFEAQNHAQQRCAEVQEKLNKEQDLYRKYNKK